MVISNIKFPILVTKKSIGRNTRQSSWQIVLGFCLGEKNIKIEFHRYEGKIETICSVCGNKQVIDLLAKNDRINNIPIVVIRARARRHSIRLGDYPMNPENIVALSSHGFLQLLSQTFMALLQVLKGNGETAVISGVVVCW
jgi:hypothetical protein